MPGSNPPGLSKIMVTVIPGSREEEVCQLENGSYRVRVKARPKEGKANDALVEVLSRHFGIPKASVIIRSGHTSRRKIVEIRS